MDVRWSNPTFNSYFLQYSDYGYQTSLLQYTSESRTRFGFWIHSYAGPDHLIAGPFESRIQKSGFQMVASLDRFINRKVS
jgi:hypothetical protein